MKTPTMLNVHTVVLGPCAVLSVQCGRRTTNVLLYVAIARHRTKTKGVGTAEDGKQTENGEARYISDKI